MDEEGQVLESIDEVKRKLDEVFNFYDKKYKGCRLWRSGSSNKGVSLEYAVLKYHQDYCVCDNCIYEEECMKTGKCVANIILIEFDQYSRSYEVDMRLINDDVLYKITDKNFDSWIDEIILYIEEKCRDKEIELYTNPMYPGAFHMSK
jgi:hypothetical protein